MKAEKPDSSEEEPKYFHNSFAEYVPPEKLPGMDFTKCAQCESKDVAERMFRVITSNCGTCDHPVKLAFVSVNEMELIFPDQFTPFERKLAKERGVYLKKCAECLEAGEYANFCRSCKEPTDYFALIGPVMNKKPECNIVSGCNCNSCGRED